MGALPPVRIPGDPIERAYRLPEDFMFRLTAAEAGVLVSQNVIPSGRYLGRALQYALTRPRRLRASIA